MRKGGGVVDGNEVDVGLVTEPGKLLGERLMEGTDKDDGNTPQ